MIDSYGRNINYLRISVTDLCNLKCKYCAPEGLINNLTKNEILSAEEIELIAKSFVELGINKIRITGGEPLVRKDILDVIQRIGKIEGVKDFAITTNGVMLEEYASSLKNLGVNRLNISLDTLSSSKYKDITRGGNLDKVIRGIREAQKIGFQYIKINVVLAQGFNDDEIETLVNLTKDNFIDVRFIELMPIGESKGWALGKFVSNKIVLEKVKELEVANIEDKSSPAIYYKLKDGKGKVGLISPISCKFCSNCNRVRVTAEGKLKLCLHSNEEIDLKRILKNKEDLKEVIIKAVNNKPETHSLENGDYIKRNMISIGG